MKKLAVESFHTVLFCRKWEECVSFYRDVMAFEVVDTRPGFVELQAASGSRIGLLRHVKKNEEANRDFPCILSFRVSDIDEAHKILSERCKGVTAVNQHPWGARLFELRDPEERRMEFWTPQ